MPATAIKSRKEQIREIATSLFKERGYAATSMRDLAKEVGIEPASLYSHIKSKEEILQKICFDIADQFFNALDDVIDPKLPSDIQLQKALEAHIDVIINNADAAAVFLHDWKFLSGEHLEKFTNQRRAYEAIFRSIILEGIDRGIFRNIDEKFLLMNIFSAMNWVYEWYKPDGAMTAKEIAENLTNFILNGILITK